MLAFLNELGHHGNTKPFDASQAGASTTEAEVFSLFGAWFGVCSDAGLAAEDPWSASPAPTSEADAERTVAAVWASA